MPNNVGDQTIRTLYEEAYKHAAMLWGLIIERSELYGALILMMLDAGKWETSFSKEDIEYARQFILFITPEDIKDGELSKINLRLEKLEKKDE